MSEDDFHYGRPDDERQRDGDPDTALREEGASARNGTSFDPTPYMRQLRGRGGAQDYLDVKWRLLWLRREHPDAEIVTEHVRIDETAAIFKATVTLPSGGKATGYGSETAKDFGDFIEKAETKAIGRALNALGYGAQFAEGDDESPAAPSAAPPSGQAARQPVASGRSAPPAAPAPRPSPAPTPAAAAVAENAAPAAKEEPAAKPQARTSAPIDFVASRERAAQSTPATATSPAPADDKPGNTAAEPDLADYSYTHFWRWARGLGYNSKGAIEELIGRPMAGLSPAQVRDLVRAARGDV